VKRRETTTVRVEGGEGVTRETVSWPGLSRPERGEALG